MRPAKRRPTFVIAREPGARGNGKKGMGDDASVLSWALVVTQDEDGCDSGRRPPNLLLTCRTTLASFETKAEAAAERNRLLYDQRMATDPETVHVKGNWEDTARHGSAVMWWCDEHERSEATAWAGLEAARV